MVPPVSCCKFALTQVRRTGREVASVVTTCNSDVSTPHRIPGHIYWLGRVSSVKLYSSLSGLIN